MKTHIKISPTELVDAVKMYVNSNAGLRSTFPGEVKFFIDLSMTGKNLMPVSGVIAAEFDIDT